ncbi:hypothetical protein TcWFU_006784 [Taenia crassiceps]|uniref:Uncharacterized protein n=1 Tax=Taenia crassiceps TaxID=6207 RepID=A0ABR4QRQ0_9CEST
MLTDLHNIKKAFFYPAKKIMLNNSVSLPPYRACCTLTRKAHSRLRMPLEFSDASQREATRGSVSMTICAFPPLLVRVFRVTYKNCIYSLEPTEFELLPNFPPSEESRSKDELPKGPLTQSLKHRLEEIKSCNARMLCRMERVYDAAGDWH